MSNKLVVIALILILSVLGPHYQVEANTTTDENRRVSETLNRNGSTEEPVVEENAPPQTPVSEPVEEPVGDIIHEQNTFLIFAQMISALALVVVLIYVLLRFLNKRSQSFRSSRLLENIGGVPLGANKSVQLVKIGDRLLVVGVGDSIQLLKEIEDVGEVESIINHQQEQLEQFDQPIQRLFNWVNTKISPKKNTHNQSTKASKSNHDAFKSLLENQLKDVSNSQKKIHDTVRERDK
ncbi:flagellar biosynthetic protein FliO [Halalkalibacter alkaliphilus]|uniref:Flagellar protein n=1 Tax=Halalkalibacter alkaliphilus TaxID=2917993 RepID=A0A9X1ZVV0_9BACI|nr:flagellar biosynthetic protein FliO [Halalkalibacter alkaliphilus]MCL7746479.1 flagellar biosynthetic protein FliO [Halalkalibacter alkaliphilus]